MIGSAGDPVATPGRSGELITGIGYPPKPPSIRPLRGADSEDFLAREPGTAADFPTPALRYLSGLRGSKF